MRKLFLLLAGFILLFCFVAGVWAQEQRRYPVMEPDLATFLERWNLERANAPKAYIDPLIAETLDWGPRPMLLDKITYTPSERNQGSAATAGYGLGPRSWRSCTTSSTESNERLSDTVL